MANIHPIVLIHGYSAESENSSKSDIKTIYGDLPEALIEKFGNDSVVQINLSRYLSLEDGIHVDDISRALHYELTTNYKKLLNGKFNVITHSTGALVIRNWIRMFSKKPSPITNLIHLAGANFGSGWAHIGKGQLAKWGRYLFNNGAERGIRVLDALELGSSWTLDLHLHFLKENQYMQNDYKIFEYVVIGSQADVGWFCLPIRYAKEDGSDGVVRVSGSNLNFNYVRFGPRSTTEMLDRNKLQKEINNQKTPNYKTSSSEYYEVKKVMIPGTDSYPTIPFTIPYECSHTGDDQGIVVGVKPREEILELIDSVISVSTMVQWKQKVDQFSNSLERTYDKLDSNVSTNIKPKYLHKNSKRKLTSKVENTNQQYDPHAQIIFRIYDQDKRPVNHYDIYFHNTETELLINEIFEHKHVNTKTANIITFYLRTSLIENRSLTSRIEKLGDCVLEVYAEEPETNKDIAYVPFYYEIKKDELLKWIVDHQTTVIDIEMSRLPLKDVFKMVAN